MKMRGMPYTIKENDVVQVGDDVIVRRMVRTYILFH